MKNITPFQVHPFLPDNLKVLQDIAYNIYWTWNYDFVNLFLRIDRELWENCKHNPVSMLGTIRQEKLEELSQNEGFVSYVNRCHKKLNAYLDEEDTWYKRNFENGRDFKIAYFSAEFGITECLRIYSGGLGILAGDHVKSASDLGLPLVGVGLLYQQGYFRQYLNIDGWQQEVYPNNDFYNLPIILAEDKKGQPLKVKVSFPGRDVYAQVWLVKVGRVSVYMLDTNIEENNHDDRGITGRLYGGGKETRINQELILGIGGVKALSALGIFPDVCHLNEGHASFLAIQRIADIMENHNISFKEALTAAEAGCIFTTHTPVPAGIDIFKTEMIKPYLEVYAKQLKISVDDLLSLGRLNITADEEFNMAYLALRTCSYYNGVSKLHGEVSRKNWNILWPGLPENEVPVKSVTNGVHLKSWVSHEMVDLFNDYLESKWLEDQSNDQVWKLINDIPPEEMWKVHEKRKDHLINFTRKTLREQLEKRGASQSNVEKAGTYLKINALTIGFARRFAPYKRATLLLRDPERLKNILCNEEYPVQMIFAGKAHPRDEEGKNLIRQIMDFSKDPELKKRFVFLEDYNIKVARYLVSGVDVWLNTPRRPLEASGTSGMKAALNGVLNCSILDGWWDEAYETDEDLGWAIGRGEVYDDSEYQDKVEANNLYNLLEKEIVPLFYDREFEGIPAKWISRMKDSIRTLSPKFNTNRMVEDYTRRFYVPTSERFRRMSENNFDVAKSYRACYERISSHWNELKINEVRFAHDEYVAVNSEVEIEAEVTVGKLDKDAVDVQIYYGTLDADKNIINGKSVSMNLVSNSGETCIFSGKIASASSGLHGFTIRILPKCTEMIHPYQWHLVHWR